MMEKLDSVFVYLIECARKTWRGTSRVFLAEGNPYVFDSIGLNKKLTLGRRYNGLDVEIYRGQYLPDDSVLIGIDGLEIESLKNQGEQKVLAWMLSAPKDGIRDSRASTILVSNKDNALSCRLEGADWEPDMSSVLFRYHASRLCYLPHRYRAFSLQKHAILSVISRSDGAYIRSYDRKTKVYRETRIVRDNDLVADKDSVFHFSPSGTYLLISQPLTNTVRQIVDIRTHVSKVIQMPAVCRDTAPRWISDNSWIEVTGDSGQYSFLIVKEPFVKVHSNVSGFHRGAEYPSFLCYDTKLRCLVFLLSQVAPGESARFLYVSLENADRERRIIELRSPVDPGEPSLYARFGISDFLWKFQQLFSLRQGETKNFYNFSVWRSAINQDSFRQVLFAKFPFAGVTHANDVRCAFDYDGVPVLIYRTSVWKVLR